MNLKEEDIVAYFSMEVALENGMPTYSGGLGVLAGDFLLTAADMQVPMVGITLLQQNGYFFQKLDTSGQQTEEADQWNRENFLQLCSETVQVTIDEREVKLKIWEYDILSGNSFIVPVYLLDSDHPENSDDDKNICSRLYVDDPKKRLCQEVVLGIGGVLALEALGYSKIKRYHMNEGHAALLSFELLKKELQGEFDRLEQSCQAVRKKCVFTTHTPVPAGHDKFSLEIAKQLLGNSLYFDIPNLLLKNNQLNMTYLALNLSGYINGVAKRHGEVAKWQNASYSVEAITNGVHAARWVSPAFAKLYDTYIPGWKEDNFSLRSACGIERESIWQAHLEEKRRLIDKVNKKHQAALLQECFTLGFARRATSYKRADLLFYDIDKLVQIATKFGKIQCIFAGKAHPNDLQGKEIIKKIFSMKEKLQGKINIVYLPNYDMGLAKLLVAGVDLWLNNPQRPLEASGTSGMKAALNGVPSLSVLDGWWIEGCIEKITGWTIGDPGVIAEINDDREDANSLYHQLEKNILPLFYNNTKEYVSVMRYCIALNGSFFNTQRMMQQYVFDAYY